MNPDTTDNESRVLKWLLINTLAIIAGIIGGVSAIAFKSMIEFNHNIFFNIIRPNLSSNNLSLIAIPVIGALISGIIVSRWCAESKGHGIPEIMIAIDTQKSRIRKRVAFIKAISSSIIIGSGGSAGSEGPIAQIGSSIGSALGQVFHLSERKIRLLTVSGLSAGIAAVFNAPLGGAIFGLELLLYSFNVLDIMPIVLASVVGTSITAQYYGYNTILRNVSYIFNPSELPLYLLLGLLTGLAAVFFVRFFYIVEQKYSTLKLPDSIKPMTGALVTGIVGFSFIEYGIYGVGYEGITQVFAGTIPIKLILILFATKIIATSFTIGSGGSGGVFAPSLYIGAMFGGLIGYIFQALFPSIVVHPMAYALLGMGAFFASVAKVPLTCIVIISEISGDWTMVAPLMAAIFISYATSSIFLGLSSIYTIKLEQIGIHRNHKHYIKEFYKAKVRDIMTDKKLITVSPDMLVEKVYDFLIIHKKLRYPVIRNKKVIGILSFHEYKNINHITKNMKVKGIMKKPKTVHSDNSIDEVFNIFSEQNCGCVLVTEGDKLIGIVTKTDIMRAYRIIKSGADDEEKYKHEMSHIITKLEKHTKQELSHITHLEKQIKKKLTKNKKK